MLAVLLGSLLLYLGLGALGVHWFAAWIDCARYALATMFFFTGVAHFSSERRDLIAMVPPRLPRPELLVAITGILEFAGALGLLIPETRAWAAWCLVLFLVAVFPANVSAARRGIGIRGRPHTPLWLRAPMQLLFILWTWRVR
ncbi:MAG TPA: DoxX family protein [Candidatus Acidoferrales bacterium]|nr:DoxX family protein [Candidatus Acidoferrales bacterium]